MALTLDDGELAELEAAVQRALESADESGLSVLGYGEISLVIAWPRDQPRVAAKRLPLFDDRGRAEAYGALITDYLVALDERGVAPVESEVVVTDAGRGRWAAYVLQPILDATRLAPAVLGSDGPGNEPGRLLIETIVDTIATSVDGRVGLDGQLSNWAATPAGLRYLDVTTPMLTDDRGATRLDLGVLTSPLPAVLRPSIRRFVAPGLAAKYHRPRDVLLDLAANLVKERLDRWIDPTVDAVNQAVDQPIDRVEVEAYYRADARLWEVMWRLRRADRWWQRTVRRRPYPTLLPGPTAR